MYIDKEFNFLGRAYKCDKCTQNLIYYLNNTRVNIYSYYGDLGTYIWDDWDTPVFIELYIDYWDHDKGIAADFIASLFYPYNNFHSTLHKLNWIL